MEKHEKAKAPSQSILTAMIYVKLPGKDLNNIRFPREIQGLAKKVTRKQAHFLTILSSAAHYLAPSILSLRP